MVDDHPWKARLAEGLLQSLAGDTEICGAPYLPVAPITAHGLI
jgi:hypothetical protein